MKTFKIETLGCKVNQFESEAIQKKLTVSGFQVAEKSAVADICIINTCTVTGKASMQSRQAIRSLINANPGSNIIVTGCYAQTEADEIKKIKGVQSIISHKDKHRIPELILKNMNTGLISDDCNQSCTTSEFKEIQIDVAGNRTRPYLKIQDGCNSFCSYCIVPYTRGRSRSMVHEDVLSKLSSLGRNNFKEIVLTGIHIGNYGKDLDPETDFYQLLIDIEKKRPVERIRISSIEPGELSDEIISLMAASDIFCDHFHIPLQSGDDGILSKMNRPYKSDLFKNRVLKIKQLIPDAAIGIDILAGFPGESDEAFQNTYDLIKDLPITYLHVFPFSPRKKTPAASMPGQIDSQTLKHRCALLRTLSQEKKDSFYSENLYTQQNVLLEHKRHKPTGMLKGITSNYINIFVDGDDTLKNRIITVNTSPFGQKNALLGTIN